MRPTNGHDFDEGRKLPLVVLSEIEKPHAVDRLIKGVLGENTLTVIYGQPGSGKSFLAFDMAMHVALGRQWFGRKVQRGVVLYVASEGGAGWHNRAMAFCEHHAIDRERTPLAFVFVPVNLGREGGDAASIIRAAEQLFEQHEEPVVLIVIDTLARTINGNENDPVDMGAFVAHCDQVRRETKATVLIVHHSGKNAALGARGHTVLLGALDTELEVERHEAGRVLRVTKSRDGLDGTEIGFELSPVTLGQDEDGDDITSCIVEAAEIARQVKLPKSVREGMPILDFALDQRGVPDQPLGPDSSLVRTVDKEALRSLYYERRGDLDNADARRQAFNRFLKDGKEAKAIGTKVLADQRVMVWKVGAPVGVTA